MPQGKVKWYNDKKRFGFITDENGEDLFLHYSDIPPGTVLQEGDRVKYEVGQAPKGKKATNIVKL